jgi:hypothetical protein
LEILIILNSKRREWGPVKVAGVKEVDGGIAVAGNGKNDTHWVKSDEMGCGEGKAALDGLGAQIPDADSTIETAGKKVFVDW